MAWQEPMKFFYVKDSLFADSTSIIKNPKFDFNAEKAEPYLKKDTLHIQRTVSIILYCKEKARKIGYINHNNNTTFEDVDNFPGPGIYFAFKWFRYYRI